MLPQEIMTIRQIGDTRSPYWAAATLDGATVLLEPGEVLLHTGYCQVSAASPEPRKLPGSALAVTQRRTVFLTTQFDTGGGWTGFGLAGLAVAVTANAVSKRRAARRSAGQVAIGQVRHEWLTGISLRRRKALIGAVDTYLDLTVATARGTQVIELWNAHTISEDFARWLVRTVSQNRAELLGPGAAADAAAVPNSKPGGQRAAPADRPGDIGWSFRGNTDELIAAAIAVQGRLADPLGTTR